MKTTGLIGGITWHSSIEYYRLLNEMVSERTDGAATAQIILYSLDFGVVKALTEADRWNELASIVSNAAIKLENAGADCILIGANTMHKIADEIQAAIHIPVIHIAEVIANAISKKRLKKLHYWEQNILCNLIFIKLNLNNTISQL